MTEEKMTEERVADRTEAEKEIRKELRRVRHKEMDILIKNRYGKKIAYGLYKFAHNR